MLLTNKRGFTLIELIISIMIIGLLTSIAIPKYNAIQVKAKEGLQKTIGHNLQLAIESYFMSTGNIPAAVSITELIEKLNQKNCYNQHTTNPFTNEAHQEQDTSGKIDYVYNQESNEYILKIYGKNNLELLTLSN